MFPESSEVFSESHRPQPLFSLVFMGLGMGRNSRCLQGSSFEGHNGPEPGGPCISLREPSIPTFLLDFLEDLMFAHSEGSRI